MQGEQKTRAHSEWAKKLGERLSSGAKIVAAGLQSSNPEIRQTARTILTLSKKVDRLLRLERELGIKPRASWRGLFLRARADIFTIVGRNNRILEKGEKTLVTGGDFVEYVNRINKLSSQRLVQLGGIKGRRTMAARRKGKKRALRRYVR